MKKHADLLIPLLVALTGFCAIGLASAKGDSRGMGISSEFDRKAPPKAEKRPAQTTPAASASAPTPKREPVRK